MDTNPTVDSVKCPVLAGDTASAAFERAQRTQREILDALFDRAADIYAEWESGAYRITRVPVAGGAA